MGYFEGDNFIKKEWKKPQITIVTRGLAQENVLLGGKATGNSGAYADDSACIGDGNGRCNDCATVTSN